jgi:hypothetical protein
MSAPDSTADLQSRLTVEQAAQHMNVSERMVYLARKLLRSGRDDLVAAVERGDLSLNAAISKLAERPKPDGYAALCRAWQKATHQERCRFMELMGGYSDARPNDQIPFGHHSGKGLPGKWKGPLRQKHSGNGRPNSFSPSGPQSGRRADQ